MSSTAERILELKRQAIALKDAGDTNGAMALLAQARDLEFENVTVDDLWEPIQLKQFAVVMKKRGDLDAARQALIKAKQIEKDGLKPSEQSSETQTQESTMLPTSENTASTKEKEIAAEKSVQESVPDKNVKEVYQESIPTPKVDENATGADEQDEGDLDELMQLDQTDDSPIDVAFTVEEMADQDMMTEFKLGGMPIPSEEDYQAKILDCKKAALAAKKAGDTTKALQELARSKQLEKVRLALSQLEGCSDLGGDADEGWMNNLNAEENELLGELLPKKFVEENAEESVSDTHQSTLDRMEDVLEELAGFLEDADLFMDALDMGMEVPKVHDIEAKAEEQKRAAVEHKKAGNLDDAKAALVKCKQFTSYAQKLKAILDEVKCKRGATASSGDASMVKLEDLESMLEANEKRSHEGPKIPALVKKVEPVENTAAQLREEAVRLRDQKKIKEAAEVLKLYKAALKREEDTAEMNRRKELVAEIRKEIEVAQHQIQIFEYYQRFCDPNTQQIQWWKEYATRCENVSKLIIAKGTKAVNVARKQTTMMLAQLEGTEVQDFNALITDLVAKETNSDPSDERLEITILALDKIQENANLQKLLKKQKRENLPVHPSVIRLEVHLQIPPNEHDTEQSIELLFESASSYPYPLKKLGEEDRQQPTFIFEKSQYVDLVRGNSAYGKIIRRRIERNKKIQITAYHVPIAEKKGWLWSKKNKEELPPPTLLGKVVLEMQGLLTKKCIAAGDYALMNGSGTKELGGSLKLAVRTGAPLGATGEGDGEGENILDTACAKLDHYTAMVFSLNKEQPEPGAPE